MKKLILFITVFIFSSIGLNAQKLNVFNIKPYGFPETSANFYAFDSEDNLVFDASPNDFEVIEDGQTAEVLSVICSEGTCPGGNFSAVLAMDISGSTRGQKLPEEKLAAEIYIDMLPQGGSELAIVGFNHKNYLVNDFSTDKTELKKSFESLTSGGGTNFNAALIDPLNGTLLVAERAKYGKRIILVTDGLSDGDEQTIIDKANQLNAKIFVVIINGQSNEFISAVTSMTGGFVFHAANAGEAESVFRQLAGISGCSGAGCTIVWKSEPTCNEYRDVIIKLKTLPAETSLSYKAYSNSRIGTTVSPSSFIFERIPLGGGDTVVTFTITNQYHPVTITDISETGNAFTIVDDGSLTTPFTLGTGETKTIEVKYQPSMDSAETGNIIIEKEYCGNHTVSFLSYDPLASDSIVVISPNGNEKYLAGSDTLITWEGNPEDSVTIEYSLDAGKTWEMITNNAKGLKYNWNVPDVESNSCLVRVYRDDNPQGLVDGMMLGLGTLCYYDINYDGTKIVTAGGSGYLYIWDLNRGVISDTLFGHYGQVTSVAWDPFEDLLASVSKDEQKIKLWNEISGYDTINSNLYDMIKVMWSPDGTKLACCGKKKLLIVDRNTGLKIQEYSGHTDYITSISWSPDGSKIVSGSQDNTAKVWDVNTGETLSTFYNHDKIVLKVNWSPDGTKIASFGYDSTLRIWDSKTGVELWSFKHDRLIFNDNGEAQWSPDGNYIAFHGYDSTIKICEANSGKELISSNGLKNVFLWSPNGDKIMSIDYDNSVIICNAKNGANLKEFKFDYFISEVNWFPDGNKIAIRESGRTGSTIRIWDISTGKELNSLEGHNGLVRSVQWSPDGSLIASGDGCKVKTWDATTRIEHISFEGHESIVNSISWRPEGRILASGSSDETIKIWDINTISEKRTLTEHSSPVKSVCFNSDGSKIASGSGGFDNSIRIWDSETFQELGIIDYEDSSSSQHYIRYLSWSFDCKKIVAAAQGISVKVWDVSNFKNILILEDTSTSYRSVAWSPDNSKIACGTSRMIRVFDAINGKEYKTIDTVDGSVYCISWSPDGKYLACGTSNFFNNSFIIIWKVDNYNLVTRTMMFNREINSISWHPNSKWIAGGSSDGTIRIFRVVDPPGDTSDTYFSIIKPKISAEDQDMLELCANSAEPKEITIEDYIKNNDIFPVRIDSIVIEGTDAGDFDVYPKTINQILEPGEGLKVKFIFWPETPGIKTAEVVCYTQYGTITKTITGEALDCNIQTVETSFDISEVCIGDTNEIIAAVLTNTGAVQSIIDSIVVLGPDFDQFELIGGYDSFTIDPGETHEIEVAFTPIKVQISPNLPSSFRFKVPRLFR